jgi:hypothetical protein
VNVAIPAMTAATLRAIRMSVSGRGYFNGQ